MGSLVDFRALARSPIVQILVITEGGPMRGRGAWSLAIGPIFAKGGMCRETGREAEAAWRPRPESDDAWQTRAISASASRDTPLSESSDGGVGGWV